MTADKVEITRRFPGSCEAAFALWTNGAKARQWWGPEGFTCPDFRTEPKLGGRYLAAMKEPTSGELVWSTGVYREFLPGKRLVMTDSFANEQGQVIPAASVGMPGEWPLECIITIDFAPLREGGTRMHLLHEGIPKDMVQDCILGWNSSFNKMERLLNP